MLTQANIQLLDSRGINILPVGKGELACGTEGMGRMIDIEEIAAFAFSAINGDNLLRGKKILISSGPTEEQIDPVRVITNRSSGKMGASLASEALAMGANVTVVSGPANIPLPSGVKVIPVRTAQQMQSELSVQFEDADICIMAAAVSDYRPANISQEKIQRNEAGKLVLELIPNPDILAGLGKRKEGRFLVGFALESTDSPQRALEKMEKKGCDMIILNCADKSLGLDTTQITILGRDGFREDLPEMSKTEASRVILQAIAQKSKISHV